MPLLRPCLKRLTCSMVRALLIALLGPATALAGYGTFNPVTNKFDVIVSVRWDATPEELGDLCSEFQAASALLLDATDGGNQLGSIRFANGSTLGELADYWVINHYGISSADGGGFGQPGQHVFLQRDPDPVVASLVETIVHEAGHYVYCLRDEYTGPLGGGCGIGGPCRCDDCDNSSVSTFCVETGNPCMMDRAGLGARNEFCWAGNHDPDGDTAQSCAYGRSCWETIDGRFNLSKPAGAPVDEPPSPDDVFCVFLNGGSVILVLDRSESMTRPISSPPSRASGRLPRTTPWWRTRPSVRQSALRRSIRW